jgi:magnesium transporter
MAKLRSEKAGLPPGALVPVSEDPVQDTTIQVFVYHGEQYAEHCAVSPEKIDVGDPASSVTWIDVNGLADLKAIKAIGERFNLHQLLLEDVLNTDHRPKVEEYQDHLFVVAKMLSLDEETDGICERADQLGAGQGLCDHLPGKARRCAGPVRERIRHKTGGAQDGRGLPALRPAGRDRGQLLPDRGDLGERIEAWNARSASAPGNEDLLTIQEIRSKLITVSRYTTPVRELAGRMNTAQTELIEQRARAATSTTCRTTRCTSRRASPPSATCSPIWRTPTTRARTRG